MNNSSMNSYIWYMMRAVIFVFKWIRYPLFVHLENHCSISQQKTAARIITELFGSALLRATDKPLTLTSPEDLIGKIILFVLHSLFFFYLESIAIASFCSNLLSLHQKTGQKIWQWSSRRRRRSHGWGRRSRNESDSCWSGWTSITSAADLSRVIWSDCFESWQQH